MRLLDDTLLIWGGEFKRTPWLRGKIDVRNFQETVLAQPPGSRRPAKSATPESMKAGLIVALAASALVAAEPVCGRFSENLVAGKDRSADGSAGAGLDGNRPPDLAATADEGSSRVEGANDLRRGRTEGADVPKPSSPSSSAGTTIRVAAISFVPVKFDLAGNADRLEKAFRSAHQGAAKIAVAPEGVLEGYVVNEIIAGKAEAAAMKEVAVAIDAPVIRRFQKLAGELEMCLVFGFAERIKDEVFNCAVFIDEAGRIRGKHHKMLFAEGGHPDWWFNRPGSQSRAFDTPYGRCGIVICNERWNPKLARVLALDGARFLVIPSYGARSRSQDDAVLLLGRENGVPIVEANVGVTLLVNEGRITTMDRNQEAITFGDITIPPAVAVQPDERDRAEREFLLWREPEMKARYQKTNDRTKGRTSADGVQPKPN